MVGRPFKATSIVTLSQKEVQDPEMASLLQRETELVAEFENCRKEMIATRAAIKARSEALLSPEERKIRDLEAAQAKIAAQLQAMRNGQSA
jgi:hypothetical protein